MANRFAVEMTEETSQKMLNVVDLAAVEVRRVVSCQKKSIRNSYCILV